MKKKAIAIVLILCLVFGVAFAAPKFSSKSASSKSTSSTSGNGKFKVGGQLGYLGYWDTLKISIPSYGYEKATLSLGGFSIEATGLYKIMDNLSVKASLGLGIMGRPTIIMETDGSKTSHTYRDSLPAQFGMCIGAQYDFAITNEITISAGGGFDMMLGKGSTDSDAKTVFRLGLGIEGSGSYTVASNIDVMIGARFSIFILDTDTDKVDYKREIEAAGGSVSEFQSTLRFFAGCTYSF